MDDSELRRRRTGRIVLAWPILMLYRTAEGRRQFFTSLRKVAIVRPLAVGSPVSFVRTGGGVEYDDAMVDVTVGDVQLIGRRVDDHVRRRTEIVGVVAAAALPLMTDLH